MVLPMQLTSLPLCNHVVIVDRCNLYGNSANVELRVVA